MASAGRVLIIPKDNFDSSVTYEMLDLVFHNGTSWIAKKTVVGIEPSDTHKEYWHKLCESVDLTEIEGRIAALENQLVNATSLDDIDLSGYATKGEVESVSAEVYELQETVRGLNDSVNSLPKTSGLRIMYGSYYGTGTMGPLNPTSLTFEFEPKLVIITSEEGTYDGPVVWTYGTTMIPLRPSNTNSTSGLQFSLEGNKLSWYNGAGANLQFNCSGIKYTWLAIG